jgi:hypothetical protein
MRTAPRLGLVISLVLAKGYPVKTLLTLALMVPVAAFAQTAPASAAADSGTVIKCSDWTKTPDGEWKGGPAATVTYEGQQLQLHKASVDQGQYYIKGQDVYTLLDTQCGG